MAKEICEQYPGTDIWGAIPCTEVSCIQNANIARGGAEYLAGLHLRRKKTMRLVKHFTKLARIIHQNGRDVHYEWPRNSHGWNYKEAQEMFKSFPSTRCWWMVASWVFDR